MGNRFYDLLSEYGLISNIWAPVSELVKTQIETSDINLKEDFSNFFLLLFSAIDDKNVCIPLDENELVFRWKTKFEQTKVNYIEKGLFDTSTFKELESLVFENIQKTLQNLNIFKQINIISNKILFVEEENWLYTRASYLQRNSIQSSIKRLFNQSFKSNNNLSISDLTSYILEDAQKEIINKGLTKNLLVTGGPGTGKTTSIVFLLAALLSEHPSYEIYLAAPSGKAAGRMKESIISGIKGLTPTFIAKYPEVYEKIKNVQKKTIHSLLSVDPKTNNFKYNRNNRFTDQSIFIIDEASMIDVQLFANLLEAIPDKARLFILGDKDQLPPVECGAVFADLIDLDLLKQNDNIVRLTVSKRFSSTSDIYLLAKAVNEGKELPIKDEMWQKCSEFALKPIVEEQYPIFYFKNSDDLKEEKNDLMSVLKVWIGEFYSKLIGEFTDLDINAINKDILENKFKIAETAKILCGSNLGLFGVNNINFTIKQVLKDTNDSLANLQYLPGELMMVNKNNKLLDLDNGDSGVLVTFKNDDTLYFMTEKTTNIVEKDGYYQDKIFKIGDFVFYPKRMISVNEINTAYAMSIHKSQGSGYKNILITLPNKKGHPLLTRQIVYTAITRTEGNTYLISNIDRLNEAKLNLAKRDTNLK